MMTALHHQPLPPFNADGGQLHKNVLLVYMIFYYSTRMSCMQAWQPCCGGSMLCIAFKEHDMYGQ